MDTAVLQHFGLTLADKLGSGWESRIYALGTTQILRIPNPEPGAEAVVRQRADFTASLPNMPFAVPRVRDIRFVEGTLITIEERIAGRSLEEMLPGLTGARREAALTAYVAVAEAMASVRAEGDYGDLLLKETLRRPHWGDYLADRLQEFADDAVLARDVPGLDAIAARLRTRLLALPDPEKCVVHGDIYPANVMMDDDLRVTGLIDFSFTTRVGDTLMDLAGAKSYLELGSPGENADSAFVMDLILARHGTAVRDLLELYAVWMAFSYAYNHDQAVVYPWCLNLIRRF